MNVSDERWQIGKLLDHPDLPATLAFQKEALLIWF